MAEAAELVPTAVLPLLFTPAKAAKTLFTPMKVVDAAPKAGEPVKLTYARNPPTMSDEFCDMLQIPPAIGAVYKQLSAESLEKWEKGADEKGWKEEIKGWNDGMLAPGRNCWGPGLTTGIMAEMAEALCVAVGHHRSQVATKQLPSFAIRPILEDGEKITTGSLAELILLVKTLVASCKLYAVRVTTTTQKWMGDDGPSMAPMTMLAEWLEPIHPTWAKRVREQAEFFDLAMPNYGSGVDAMNKVLDNKCVVGKAMAEAQEVVDAAEAADATAIEQAKKEMRHWAYHLSVVRSCVEGYITWMRIRMKLMEGGDSPEKKKDKRKKKKKKDGGSKKEVTGSEDSGDESGGSGKKKRRTDGTIPAKAKRERVIKELKKTDWVKHGGSQIDASRHEDDNYMNMLRQFAVTFKWQLRGAQLGNKVEDICFIIGDVMGSGPANQQLMAPQTWDQVYEEQTAGRPERGDWQKVDIVHYVLAKVFNFTVLTSATEEKERVRDVITQKVKARVP